MTVPIGVVVDDYYVPHRRGGGHIVFGADPVGVSIGTFLFARYLMNQWVDFNQTCMDVTLGHDEELIRFW